MKSFGFDPIYVCGVREYFLFFENIFLTKVITSVNNQHTSQPKFKIINTYPKKFPPNQFRILAYSNFGSSTKNYPTPLKISKAQIISSFSGVSSHQVCLSFLPFNLLDSVTKYLFFVNAEILFIAYLVWKAS